LEILTTRRRRSRLGYGQFCEVRFRDTGIGIPRDRLKKLFIPFYTTKQKGTGLGLAISHRIINQHGGTIEVRSTIGQGSTFSVFLPAAEQIPAGEVKDITETGGLRPLKAADRTDPTPPSTSAASTAHAASASSAARTAGATAAVATFGTQVESILPGDPLADPPSMDTSTSSEELAPPATGEPAVVSPDPSADGPGTAPPVIGEAAGERP
ncbi:MAG TPA: ATP-binding protein, partial [Devosia sp.]|nr:ATP-binding protein [Devosia sp.]